MDTFFTLLTAVLALVSVAYVESHVIMCYYDSWATYRKGDGHMDISTMDPHLCTHLIYAFAGVNKDGTIKILDKHNDLPDDGGNAGYKKLNDLRKRNKDLKTLISIGGWKEGSSAFTKVVSSKKCRKAFVDNIIKFVNDHGFDGVDIDWVYPTLRGGAMRDKDNFVLLLKELAKYNMVLTAAVAAVTSVSSKAYIIADIAKYVNYINMMTYDFNGGSLDATSFAAPLYPSDDPKSDSIKSNIDTAVKHWIHKGAPASKIVIGIPFYGRGFTLQNPGKHDVGARAKGYSLPGPYTREEGTMGYNELCPKLNKGDWHVARDLTQKVPYAYKGNQWIGYEDAQSIKEKADYVRRNKLGGAMVWSVDGDDFRGICGEKFVLLKALNYAMKSGSQ